MRPLFIAFVGTCLLAASGIAAAHASGAVVRDEPTAIEKQRADSAKAAAASQARRLGHIPPRGSTTRQIIDRDRDSDTGGAGSAPPSDIGTPQPTSVAPMKPMVTP